MRYAMKHRISQFRLQRDSNPGPRDQKSKALTTLPRGRFASELLKARFIIRIAHTVYDRITLTA